MTGGNGLWKLTTDALDLSGPLKLRLFTSTQGEITPDGGFTNSSATVTTFFIGDALLASSGSGLTIVSNSVSNTNPLTFSASNTTRSIGSYAVMRVGVSDPSEALLFYWNLSTPLVVGPNDTLQVAAGALSFQFL